MMDVRDDKAQSRVLALFAQVFDYPDEQLAAIASECAALVANASAQAAKEMREFGSFAESVGSERMEEIYTRTFDVTPTTTLYVGYHLFGDSYKRGAFLVNLQHEYRERGFSAGAELADHLSPVLKFASLADDPQFVHPLLFEAVLPSLVKVEDAFRGSDNCYRLGVSALKAYLEQVGAGYIAENERAMEAGEGPAAGFERSDNAPAQRVGVQG